MVSQLGFAYLQRSHWENCHYELEGSFWTWKHLANLHLSFCLLRPEANDTSAWDYYICALMHLLYLFQSPAWREKTYHKKYTKRAKKISCHSVKQKSFNLWLSRNCHNFFPCENCCEQAENLTVSHESLCPLLLYVPIRKVHELC